MHAGIALQELLFEGDGLVDGWSKERVNADFLGLEGIVRQAHLV